MREIKFRAWDKNLLEMFYNRDNITVFSWPAEHHELMQYTGLRDKNGKEIYEGDIVAFVDKPLAERSPEHGGPKKPRVIRWRKNGYNLTHLSKDGTARGVEIIGNIYENPDLLAPQEPTV